MPKANGHNAVNLTKGKKSWLLIVEPLGKPFNKDTKVKGGKIRDKANAKVNDFTARAQFKKNGDGSRLYIRLTSNGLKKGDKVADDGTPTTGTLEITLEPDTEVADTEVVYNDDDDA